jgi:hypothetical protein
MAKLVIESLHDGRTFQILSPTEQSDSWYLNIRYVTKNISGVCVQLDPGITGFIVGSKYASTSRLVQSPEEVLEEILQIEEYFASLRFCGQ